MKLILPFLLALFIYSLSFGQPCKDIPDFKNSEEAINWIENASFEVSDVTVPTSIGWVFIANYYSCDGKVGYLILWDQSIKKYISYNVEISKWNELKSSNDIGKFYVEKIRPNEKYNYNNEKAKNKKTENPSNVLNNSVEPRFLGKDVSVEEFNEIKLHAENGNVDAQYSLALKYLHGKGTFRDQNEAFYWFQKAAKQNNPDAQEILGSMYASGRGTLKDMEQAFYWFQKAAEQNNADAQHKLGIIYKNGDGILKNPNQAFYWFQKAAEQGNHEAQFQIGFQYSMGEGTIMNVDEAFYWFQKAAEQNNVDAQLMLGHLFIVGLGTQTDYSQAAKWVRKAYENGSEEAKELWETNELWKYE